MQTYTTNSPRAGGVGTTLSLILLGSLLTVAATVFCYQHLKPAIEQELTLGVTAALQGTGVNQFTVEGQDVILSGAVNSAAASDAAVAAAASVYGVSNVINNLTVDGNIISDSDAATAVVTPVVNEPVAVAETTLTDDAPLVINNAGNSGATPSTFTLVVNDGVATTQGIVSDVATIERINTALVGKFGKGNLKDGVSTFEGSDAPTWIDGMLSMIDQLDGIRNPIIKVTGQDLVLAGSVTSEEIRRAKLSTAERLLGTNFTVVDNLSVNPTKAEPITEDVTDQVLVEQTPAQAVNKRQPSLGIQSNNNQITIDGFVANEADANALRDGMDALFGSENYIDELTIDNSVASAPWIANALSVTSSIDNVNDFGLNISNGQMLLSGNVADRDVARDISISASEAAGSSLDVLNNFSVNNAIDIDGDGLMGQSLMQELNALPTGAVVFNKNSTTLADSAKDVLDEVAAAILGYDDLVIEIAGHTDSSGDAVKNLKISKQRATAVRDYLVEQGVPSSRLSPIGYGETAPISDNETSQGRAANRRIEFNL